MDDDRELGRRLENHAAHCKLESNCPICWKYGLYLMLSERKHMGRIADYLWIGVVILYFSVLAIWLMRCA